MKLGQLIRRWGLASALALISFGSWKVAQEEAADEASVQRVDYEQSLSTPMLSARRIPRTLQAPVIDDRIRPSLKATIDASPPNSCLLVETIDRRLTPTSNVSTGFVPASNQKILTTYGALHILGPDFRFRTTVQALAAPVNGVIDGDLFLVGDGDPFLTTDSWWTQYENVDGRFHTRLEDLADAVVDAGVTTINGRLVGDESLFDNVRRGPWAERLIAGKQSGPLSALTVNEGFVDWPTPHPGSARLRGETDNPPLHAVSVLGQLLQERGVTFAGSAAEPVGAGFITVAEVQSPPLTDIATHINSFSSNIGAELLLKRLGVATAGVGSTESGSAAVLALLQERTIPIDGVVVRDGSGLAESNRLTCAAISAILADASPVSPLGRSLSISGERGSLAKRFIDTPADGAVLAKTGTLDGVSALSGYLRSATNPDVYLTFAYLANEEFISQDELRPLSQELIKSLQQELLVALTTYPGAPELEELDPLEPVPT